jgi:acyl-CoA synthetase (AMP-forming)/AMP-acid ligase II
MPPTSTATLPNLVRGQARRFGERPFITLGPERISYAEAESRSARLARGLLATGVGKGTRVGVMFPNGPGWVVAWLAAARIGAIVVPLNTFYKPRELGWVLGHADVDTLLTVSRFRSNDYLERLESVAPTLAERSELPLFVPELPRLRSVYAWGEEGERSWARTADALELALTEHGEIDDAFLEAVEATVTPADPMLIIYSSGSTAEPKGAIHGHGAVLRHSENLNAFRDLEADDRIFSPMPFFWVGGLVFTLLAAMHRGAFLVCEEVFLPGDTLALLERERVTIAAGWPHYSKAMLAHPTFAQRDLSSIRGGNLYDMLPGALRPGDPELRSNSLGMTETCGPHSIDRMDVDLPESLRGSFGRAAPGVEHKVVEPESGAPLPAGEPGEICVRGASLMQGLYKVEREDTFDRDGFYHTGDGGWLSEDGHLYFQGRLGDMIKTAGASVAPREVEVALEALPEVASAFVVGVADDLRGQNVAAAVVLERGRALDATECRTRLRRELSAYKVPRHTFFFEKSELPFTDSGKIDKRRLEPLLIERIASQQRAR